MNGLLLVDKPLGVTSFDVVRRARRWCGTRQVGHCGTLDPAASGLLPVAVGSCTRLVEYLMDGDKEYAATLRLGVVTDTQDGEGQVLETRAYDGIGRRHIEDAATAFVGLIDQVPPMYSALKRDGVPLYRLARQGVEVERAARRIRIDAIEILDCALPFVTMRVACGKGTYIRTLCHDLGQALGCGGSMAALRRTRCGAFRVDDAAAFASLDELASQGRPLPIIPPGAALPDLADVQVLPAAHSRLANGIAPVWAEVVCSTEPAAGELVRLMAGDRLAAVAHYAPGRTDGRQGDFVLDKVFPEAFRSA
ncbi:MAG: tRNA pseudouridine(55) synthase TruB [Deltaproteobacteria bacterium]|nr:MAG: tRNA pseudouridine(55) synthase TruB [Deltaproteobacteria bacterium]